MDEGFDICILAEVDMFHDMIRIMLSLHAMHNKCIQKIVMIRLWHIT